MELYFKNKQKTMATYQELKKSKSKNLLKFIDELQ